MKLHRSVVIAAVALLPGLVACEATTGPQDFAPQFSENTTTGDAGVASPSPVTGATHEYVFPSTNEANVANGWSNVLFADVDVGRVQLTFTQPRSFGVCFEYRPDDEPATYPGANPNPNVEDAYEYHCLNYDGFPAGETTEWIQAREYVDIRISFGAERDERFDWTRFYVATSLDNRDQCRDGAWEAMGFRNLGQCIRYVETGQDGR
jgi:hypothetical protein